MSTAWWVRLGGVMPASVIAPHSPATYETTADRGCFSASFGLGGSVRTQHQLLRQGTLVEVMCGATPMWAGELSEHDRNSGEVHASGLASTLYDYLALDGLGNSTRNVQVAIDRAVSAGWKGRNPYGVGVDTVVPGDEGAPISVGQLMDELAEWYPGGLRWGVDRTGCLFTRAPGVTNPRWMAMPDAAAFGTTSENTATRLVGRYFDGVNDVNAYAGSGAPERAEDLKSWGTLTAAQAEQILEGKLLRTTFTGWVNGVTLGRSQFRTLGNTPAFLGMVNAGDTMRAHGLPYSVTQGLFLDVEIGKTSYVAGADSVTVEPINTAPRNMVDVIAAA